MLCVVDVTLHIVVLFGCVIVVLFQLTFVTEQKTLNHLINDNISQR